jgi:hypothetical protein
VKVDGKVETTSFFEVKLLKCHFEEKNQFKYYSKERRRFEEKKEEE